ncbi:hypothetical protein BPORC_1868 [Bifidobacterium porcinum]|nr:hypothetical protein BPORC_1868 [Bifidobacterium porcinum]
MTDCRRRIAGEVVERYRDSSQTGYAHKAVGVTSLEKLEATKRYGSRDMLRYLVSGFLSIIRVCRPVMQQKRSPDVSAGAKEREEKKKGSVIIMGLRTKPHRFASLRGGSVCR